MTSILESAGALITRIISTISVSSWLPSGTLVVALVLLEDMSDSTKVGLFDAIRGMADYSWGRVALIVVLVAGVAALIQPFQFSMIRILEGYWGPLLTGSWGKLDSLRPTRWAEAFQWKKYALIEWAMGSKPVGRARELEHFRITRFPEQEGRMMPTALGNVMRSAEDAASAENDPIQTALLLRFDDLPDALQRQHDLFRDRLDVFAQLVFVWLVVGIASIRLLPPSEFVTIAFCFFAAFFSYRACIGSAEGYGQTLRTIRQAIDGRPPVQQRFELKAVN